MNKNKGSIHKSIDRFQVADLNFNFVAFPFCFANPVDFPWFMEPQFDHAKCYCRGYCTESVSLAPNPNWFEFRVVFLQDWLLTKAIQLRYPAINPKMERKKSYIRKYLRESIRSGVGWNVIDLLFTA